MRISAERLILATFAACATQRTTEPRTTEPQSSIPSWLKEECIEARGEVIRVVGESKGSGDEKLQKAIDEVKRACDIPKTEISDVLHVLLEDISESRKTTETAPPLPSATPTCDEMLDDFDTVPHICGVPDISVLIEKCGAEVKGIMYGIEPVVALSPENEARWPASDFDVRENHESMQAICYRHREILIQGITRLAYGKYGRWWQSAISFYMKEKHPLIGKTVYRWGKNRGPVSVTETKIQCSIPEIQRLFRNRLCPSRRKTDMR